MLRRMDMNNLYFSPKQENKQELEQTSCKQCYVVPNITFARNPDKIEFLKHKMLIAVKHLCDTTFRSLVAAPNRNNMRAYIFINHSSSAIITNTTTTCREHHSFHHSNL